MTTAVLTAIDEAIGQAVLRRKRRALAKLERTTAAALRTAFRRQKGQLLAAIETAHEHLSEAAEPSDASLLDDDEQRWVRNHMLTVTLRSFDSTADSTKPSFIDALVPATEAALLAGGKAAIADLDIQGSFDLQNPRAVAYMQQHGAATIDEVNATTRKKLNAILTKGISEGQSYQEIGKAIREAYDGFARPVSNRGIRDRAELIAVNELNSAYEHSNRAVADELAGSGLPVEKHWYTSHDERVDEPCHQNEDAGWIALADAFPTGAQQPPQHAGCRCYCGYQTKEAR